MSISKIRIPSVLLIIDVQEGFLNDETRHVVPRIESLVATKSFTTVVATCFKNSRSSPFSRFLGWKAMISIDEQRIPRTIEQLASHAFEKSGYSACTHDLLEFLSASKIDRVALAGVDTDACVLATALHLFSDGIEPFIITDCCASIGGAHYHDTALRILARAIGPQRLIPSATFGAVSAKE